MKLSIVIPVYNEKDSLEEIFRLLQLTRTTKKSSQWTTPPPTVPGTSWAG